MAFPLIHEDADPRPAARKPLGGWRLENGRLPVALEADVNRDAVLVLEPQQPVETDPGDPPRLALEARPGGTIEPRLAVVPLGVTVAWRNADASPRTVTLEDGDTLLPPETTPPGGAREVRFTIAGEYVFLDPQHPFARATVVVVGSPYAARLDERGAFAIEAPRGRYRVKAWWHGRWSEAPSIEVPGTGRDLVVRLGADPPRVPASKRPQLPAVPAGPPVQTAAAPVPPARRAAAPVRQAAATAIARQVLR